MVAHVAQHPGLEAQRPVAAPAADRVDGVLIIVQPDPVVLDAEVGHRAFGPSGARRAQGGDPRVIRVQHETCPEPAADHRLPGVGQRIELAVPVESIAKEIAEHDQVGGQLGGDDGQPGLVDLEDAVITRLLE